MRAGTPGNAGINCCCCVLAPRRNAPGAARGTQAFEPTLTASGQAAKRRAECASQSQPVLVFFNYSTLSLTAAAAVGVYGCAFLDL